MEILWSVNLPNDGPVGIEFGKVNTRVTTANTAIVPSNVIICFGLSVGMGLPIMYLCTGILAVVCLSTGTWTDQTSRQRSLTST